MTFWFRRRRSSTAKRRSARLDFERLEERDLLTDMSTAALALVDNSHITTQALRSGNWSNPSTWQNGVVPAANANVLIPSLFSVTLDGTTNPVHSIRVDGTLQFATNLDTNLVVDTLVVNMTGSLVIGTAANPISAQHQATITFTASGPINTRWDPNVMSRGLIAMGTVTMYGAATTPWVTLAHDAAVGATTLTLAQLPANWKVGDEIVLGGTYAKAIQDEDLHILSIQGNQITVAPLANAHTSSNGVPVYLTDVTRNIILQSQDQSTIGNRGQVLLMCPEMVNIHYAEFLGLGRTNKSVLVNDPQLSSTGTLIAGTGTNPRDRYPVDLWETDTTPATSPAIVDGSTVVGSPGWGFVNHSSYVNFTNDVAFNVDGASFVSEAGDETGSFSSDLAIHSLGTGSEDFYDPTRVPLQDWGHEGDGFWMQGNGVAVTNNIALGQQATGYYYFNQPYTAPVQNVVPSTAAMNFHNNLAESILGYGAYLRYETNGGVIDNLTVHDSRTGFKEQYCNPGGITVQNSHFYGTPFSDYGIFLPTETAQGFLALNDTVIGFPVGILFSEENGQSVTGGTWNNHYNFEIPNAIQNGRSITITNPTFVPSTDPTHYDIYWLPTFNDVYTRSISAFFVPDTVLYNGTQLFAPWQNANFIPFTQQPSMAPPLPAALMGKTNQQLLSSYGLAMGGALAPGLLVVGASTNGTAGAPAVFQPILTLVSPAQTTQLTGYQLQYAVGNGPIVTVPTLFNLVLGWNMITIPIGGLPRTFYVFAGPYIPSNLGQAASVFAHSTEYYSNFVTAAYQRYLGRAPDGPGLSGWVTAMQHGLSDERLEASFLGSAEYVANHGGLGQAWIISLYQQLLNRTPSATEVSNWLAILAGGMSPTDVAFGFAASRERETLRVANDYTTYLGRQASQTEINAWVNLFFQGFRNEDVIAGFVGSAEYYLSASRGAGSNSCWIMSAYRDVLHRTPSTQEQNNWLNFLQ
jgi:hypothetical protein